MLDSTKLAHALFWTLRFVRVYFLTCIPNVSSNLLGMSNCHACSERRTWSNAGGYFQVSFVHCNSLAGLTVISIRNLDRYKKGVSLLLRESLSITAKDISGDSALSPDALASACEKKLCVTDHKGTILERVGDKFFEYTAGSFFQNNNSVLVPLTSYARDAIFPEAAPPDPKPTHLVDAYCGSGLFSIMLSPHFDVVRGIELSAEGIRASKVNARLNEIPDEKISFLEGDAANIFDTVKDFPREKTVLIIDPPRKGSDEKFINQLIQFACQTVVYVSCNVHTQARDVGMILRKSEANMKGKKYVLESVRGFDLFPQTAHVESVAVLKLVDA